MTAIAGAIGAAPTKLGRWTFDLLEEQRPYGGAVGGLETMDGAAFAALRPAFSEAFENLLVVADLRLDNGVDVARRLGLPSSTSDQALLARAWSKSGPDCLDWLVGDFAFAIFDKVSRTLFLARDPTGQRPLHYAKIEGAILFASMPGAFRATNTQLAADRMTVAKLAAQYPNTAANSYFEGVSRVRQGELVSVRLGGDLRSEIYWNPSLEPKSPKTRPQLVEEFRYLLDTAVEARIRRHRVPVAAHLSSGFDSSSVTATAARLLKSPGSVVAFTSAPRFAAPMPRGSGWFADESAIAAETARMHGIRHVVVRDAPPVMDVIREYGPLLQVPMTGALNMAWWLEIRRQAAALGAGCILTAELGNQSLNLGGLGFLADYVRARAWRPLFRQIADAASAPDSRVRGVLMSAFGPWLPKIVTAGLERAFLGTRPFRWLSFLRPEWQAAADRAGEHAGRTTDPYRDVLHSLRGEDPGEFRKAAVASHRIEELDPMSDRRLLEFALTLPPQQLYSEGVNRPLMREALADRLPAAVFQARGRGMQAADWGARLTPEGARAMLEEMSASATAHELFDLDRIGQTIEQWPAAQWNRLSILQQFLTALIPSLAIGMFLAGLERS